LVEKICFFAYLFVSLHQKLKQISMKRIFICLITLGVVVTVQAKKWTVDEVKSVIKKVNTYWQTNNPAEVRAFWDHAAYHTGNIEVYKLLKDQKMLDYSIRWAEHNQWKGATESDPSKWKYKKYGEGQDYVLFGDWQICFQTYMDLYQLAPDEKKVARAKEVMGYEADSKVNDYWWWADALYMVMPVMTKMYKLTGDTKYLRKLYENILYSDSIMLDQETGLYFRDGKYVYPKHKTASGKKDFWARGDGWVLAGLAKVLQDMPETYVRQPFFVEKYVNLARGVKRLQQPEGHWTRSMMDPEQAPGFETSGTAFFCYGLLWGVNNGYLSKKEFAPAIEKAWNYLTTIALQKDGKVGYVQPIGERAIPGQTVNADSQANFGVGAFLLAACEYVRYMSR
jgi:rhamnogalacturonyl hydrolase YesR